MGVVSPLMPRVNYVAGSIRKICQLTGEFDRERSALAFNRTESRVGLTGTDLGSSFRHGGRLWFLFGDSWPDPGLGDSVAFTTDADPEQGVHLEFLNTGGRFVCPRVDLPGGGQLQRAVLEVPDSHLRINMISAVSSAGALRFMTYQGALDAALFIVFLTRLLQTTTHPGKLATTTTILARVVRASSSATIAALMPEPTMQTSDSMTRLIASSRRPRPLDFA